MPGIDDMIDKYDDIDGSNYGEQNNEPEDDLEEEGLEEGAEGNDGVDDDEQLELPLAQRKNAEPDKSGNDARKPKEQGKQGADNSGIKQLQNGLHVDAKGNIVDPRDGVIIARAGSERRLFEKAARMQSEVDNRQTRITQLENELRTTQFLNDIPRQYGLQNDDVQQALALAVVFKKDPVQAAKTLVEMALASGHNLSDILGKDAGDAVETRAISRMIDERIAPLTQRQQQEREFAERRAGAERAMNQFIEQHEHSDLHLAVLDRMIGDNPNLTPQQAYYELKLFATKHNLDFSQPLAPQIAALQGRGSQDASNTNRTTPRQRSMPNGRTADERVNTRPVGNADQFDPSLSWNDIIGKVMSGK